MLHVVIGTITVSLLAIRNCVMCTGCVWLIAFWGYMLCRSTYNLLQWSSRLLHVLRLNILYVFSYCILAGLFLQQTEKRREILIGQFISCNGYAGVLSEWYYHRNSKGQSRCGCFRPIFVM